MRNFSSSISFFILYSSFFIFSFVLAAYPEIVLRAANSYEPHQVGNYLKELAALFHGWYNLDNTRIIDEQNIALSQARLLLSINVQQVLRNGLELLGVSAPETM